MDQRKLERIVKGFANHRRIEIMELLQKNPHLSVMEVARELGVNFKTISEHLRRLMLAGLVDKKNMGSEVEHTLSKTGFLILKFLRTLE